MLRMCFYEAQTIMRCISAYKTALQWMLDSCWDELTLMLTHRQSQ